MIIWGQYAVWTRGEYRNAMGAASSSSTSGGEGERSAYVQHLLSGVAGGATIEERTVVFEY